MCILRVKVGKQRATTKVEYRPGMDAFPPCNNVFQIPYSDHARFQVNIANLFRVYMDGYRWLRHLVGDNSEIEDSGTGLRSGIVAR